MGEEGKKLDLERRRRESTLRCRRIWFIVLIPAAFFLKRLTEGNAELTERIFSEGIYRYYAIALGFFTEKVPFSLMEFFLILAPFLFLGIISIFFVRLITRKGKRIAICVKAFGTIIAIFSIVFFWLTLTCLVNYNRYTFAEIASLEVRDSSEKELYELCLVLAERAKGLRAELLNQNESGAFQLSDSSVRQLGRTAQKAYMSLSDRYSQFDYRCPLPKPIHFSTYMSYTDLVGVYCPFTMETNINIDVAHYSIPSTICHELAHYYGFMREDEANFIGYLACMESDSLEFQYSGTMLALIHAGNQLSRTDTDRYNELWTHYSREMITDLEENSRYWDAFENSKVMEVSTAINDSYLKANHQEDGVRSYGRMVDLLLAAYRKQK